MAFRNISGSIDNIKQFPILRNLAVLVVFLLLAVVINSRMVRDGLNGMGDLRWHIIWIQYFSSQFLEGDLYPRWLEATNYGYGSPTFVFYPPLVYYLGSALRSIGLTVEQIMSALFTACLVLSGLSFYFYGKYKWGWLSGFLGGIFYMSLPNIFDSIFYGVLPTALAAAFIPLGVLLTDLAFESQISWIFLAVFSFFLALLHLPSLLLFTLVWVGYLIFLSFKHPFQTITKVAIAGFGGFGVASFYLLPAIFEQKYVNIDHMAESKGGWQENMLGSESVPILPIGGMGTPNYVFNTQFITVLLLVVTVIVMTYFLRDTQEKSKIIRETIGWLALLLLITFFMSQLSEPIWAQSSILQKVQRPTRLVSIFSFGCAGMAALSVNVGMRVRSLLRLPIALILTIAILLGLHYSYKRSRALPAIHNPGGGQVVNLEIMTQALYKPEQKQVLDVTEYRPLLPDGSAPPEPVLQTPPVEIISGDADVEIEQWRSQARKLKVEAREPSVVRLRTYYYPAWKLSVNGRPVEIERPSDGTMQVRVDPGQSDIVLQYTGTPMLRLGLIGSVLSATVLGIMFWLFRPAPSRARE